MLAFENVVTMFPNAPGSRPVSQNASQSRHVESLICVQSIINQILRQGQQAKRYLEFQDAAGQTPLIIAAYRGYFSCVDLVHPLFTAASLS